MSAARLPLLTAGALLVSCGALAAAHAAGPQHDIFAPPRGALLKPPEPHTVTTIEPAIPPEWKPELRAIIKSGESALVNVEGHLVQIGQQVDGYRLVEVQGRHAVFLKDTVRYTLVLGASKPTPTRVESAPLKTSDVLTVGAPPAAAQAPAADARKTSDGSGR